MPELIVVTFDSEAGADEARNALRRLPKEQMALIEEAMVATENSADGLGFDRMRTQPSRLISWPRTIAGAAFSTAFRATAWAIATAGAIGGTAIRGAQRIDGRSVKEIEARLVDAKSTLFLITDGAVPIELVESLSEQDAKLMHTTISVGNAEVLKDHLQPK